MTNVSDNTIVRVDSIIEYKGGYREKALLGVAREYVKGETWNKEHRIVNVIATEPNEYGHHDGCAVDILTYRIVG